MRKLLLKKIAAIQSMVVLATVAQLGCGKSLTIEDSRRLDKLRASYGSEYSFTIDEPVYLRVTRLSQGPLDLEVVRSIYAAFWLNESGNPRTDSNLVYLNAYDNANRWQVQLFWDPKQNRIVAEKAREYH